MQWCFFDEKREYSRSHLVTKSLSSGSEYVLFETVGTTQYSNKIYLSLDSRYANAWTFWPKDSSDYAIALTNEKKVDYYNFYFMFTTMSRWRYFIYYVNYNGGDYAS